MMQGRELLDAYLNGEDLTPEQGEALSQWICSSDQHSELAAELMHLNQALAQAVKDQSAAPLVDAEGHNQWDRWQPEANADIRDDAAAANGLTPSPIHLDAEALTKEKYLSAMSYIVRHTFTPNRVAVLATAAAVLLCAVLAIVLLGGPKPSEQIAEQPSESSEPGRVGPALTNPIVATLTAERDAVWAPQPGGDVRPGALRPGTQLSAGQRLILTQGFAEITTNDGAIAILEAPATIELLDNDNALQLHSGKLVGICETPSSKGFVVSTPHMDITDLGTRFGVDSSSVDATEVHVYRGLVEVALNDSKAPETLAKRKVNEGQAVRFEADKRHTVLIDLDYQRFTMGLGTYRLPGTGVGYVPGQLDPNWRVVAVNGIALNNPEPLVLPVLPANWAQAPNDPGVAQWLTIADSELLGNEQGGDFTIQSQLDIPETIDLDRASLRLTSEADDMLLRFVVNGSPVPAYDNPNQTRNFRETKLLPLREMGLRHGENTIRIDIRNTNNTSLYLYIAWKIVEDPSESVITD